MKILLLDPNITLSGFAKKGARPKTGYIHLGLCYISAALKKEGHEVFLADLRELTSWEELRGRIKSIMPDIVGITMLSLDFNPAIKSAEIVKEVNPGIKIIVGGVHPTIMESELIENQHIDYIFKGEAEVTLPKILEGIASGSIKTKVIQGTHPDLNKIPFADRFLFNILEAPIIQFLKMPTVTVLTSRGCAYNCSFCQPTMRLMHGSRVRRISVERFVEELEFLRDKMDFNSFTIHDDCFTGDTAWIQRFLKLYRKKAFKKPFVCLSRADIIVRHPELFRDLKRHGLVMLIIGFESGNQRILNFIRKGVTVAQNYKAAEICRKLGIRVWANIMFGVPAETTKEAAETVNMVKKIKPYVTSPTFYVPNPGSDLYNFCMKNGLSLIKNHTDYDRTPETSKIKEIDYEFLRKAIREVTKMPYSVRVRRRIDKIKLGRFNRELIRGYKGNG